MKLLELTATDVRGLPNGSYRFADADDEPAAVTLVTGAGPTGKTSLLDAVVAAKELVAPYGVTPSPLHFVRRGAARASIIARWLLDDEERALVAQSPDPDHHERAMRAAEEQVASGAENIEVPPPPPIDPIATIALEVEATRCDAPLAERYRGLFARYSREPKAAKLEYFHSDRQIRPLMWNEPGPMMRDRLEAAPRLTRELGKYGFVRRYLADLCAAAADKLADTLGTHGVVTQADHVDVLAPIREAMASLTPDLRLARVELGEPNQARIWFAHRDGPQVELDDLSSFEQQGVLFATAFQRQGLDRSLVLVDDPERDIPRARQLPFFKALAALAPKGQLIAATASPEIVAGMKGTRVIDLASAG